MIRRILVGLGGTPFTPTAIRYAVELAQVQQADILGMTVIDRRRLAALHKSSGRTKDAIYEMRRLDSIQKNQEQSVADFEQACANAGLRYDVTQESGDPFETMISQARYHDLMVFGLRSLFDYDVVDTAPTDVLTRLVSRGVRPILAVSQEYRPIQRALLAYSGSMESAKAIRRFMQMQLWPELSLRIVTFEHTPKVANELLADVAGYCRSYGYEAEIEHVAGSAKELLLRHATDWKADVIVVGNSVKRLWLKKLFGETAMYVIRNATVPLFLSQ